MYLEVVYRIYRRLLIKSPDYCHKVVITRDGRNSWKNPTDVNVVFIPRKPRELKYGERQHLRRFADYHKLWFEIRENGDMTWASIDSVPSNGKEKNGKTS